ncbi:MAG: helix-turn-helix domain-containing protein [Acidobacteria bacterium]|nr:helix-turn-helix domain-containing protein [Acidobacteriota bacterium]
MEQTYFDYFNLSVYKEAWMEQYRIREAAVKLGISYQTLKLWIYQGKVSSTRTVGGHHRIPGSEIDRLIGETRLAALEPRNQAGLSEISGRNKLLGIVTNVKYSGLLAQVTIDICGQTVTSIITADACRELKIQKGVAAYALIKATEVMLIKA